MLRYLIAALILSATAFGAWWLHIDRLTDGSDGDGHRFLADIDHWHRTPRQQWVTAHYDLSSGPQLADIPLQLGNWLGSDVSRSRQDVLIYLEPDYFISRYYALPDGRALWLSLIGSQQAKSFHPPQVCYNGWQTDVQGQEIELAEGRLHTLRVVARQGDQEHIVIYCFLWPNADRVLEDGMVMFKVTVTQRQGTFDEAITLQQEFIRLFFAAAEP
ncbi:MAG: exosortase-associated EpsI family protein [Chloroflexota bacterium]